jgi:hypothetical protein
MINKKVIPVVIIVLSVMVVGIAAYQYVKQKKIEVPSVGQINNNPNTTDDKNPASTTNNAKPQTADKDFCVNNMLGIRLPYDRSSWNCKVSESTNANGVNEMILSKQNIILTFSNGDRGESCLSCATKKNIVSNEFVTLTKFSNSSDGNIITYFGSLTDDPSVWVSISRTSGMENVYGMDFTAKELAEIVAALSPTAGKN